MFDKDPQQQDSSDGIFNLMDPSIIQRQEAAQRQAQDAAALKAQLAMPVGDQARALVFQGGTDLGRIVNQQFGNAGTPQESPAVARARKLQEAMQATSGIADQRERFLAIGAALDANGLTDDAAKVYARVREMDKTAAGVAKDKATTAKTEAETKALDPRVTMRKELIAKGISAIDADAYAATYDPTTGRFAGKFQLNEQTVNEYEKPYVDASGALVQKVASGKDKGKVVQVVAPKQEGTKIYVDARAKDTDNTIKMMHDIQDQVGKSTAYYTKKDSSLASLQAATLAFAQNPTPQNQARMDSSLQEALITGDRGGSPAERANLKNLGDIVTRIQGSVSRGVRGRSLDEQIVGLAQMTQRSRADLAAEREAIIEQHKRGYTNAGVSGLVIDGALPPLAGVKGNVPPSDNTTDTKTTRIEDKVAQKRRAEDRIKDNAEKNRRAADREPVAVPQGVDSKGRKVFTF